LKLRLKEENATVEDVGDWCFRFKIDKTKLFDEKFRNEELYKE
jgi:hypothetical protein